MKFVVTQKMFDEVEVKLHWETKEKIRKFCLVTGSLAALVVGTVAYSKHEQQKNNIEE